MKFTQWVNRAALLLVFYSASGFAAEPGVTDTDLKIGQFAAQSVAQETVAAHSDQNTLFFMETL